MNINKIFHNRVLYGTILLITACLFYSCQNKCSSDYLQKLMGEFYMKKIQYPKGLKLMNENLVSKENAFNLKEQTDNKYIIHLFSTDCDKCINELVKAREFITRNGNDYKKLKFIFIGTGPHKVYVDELITNYKFEYPIYYSKNTDAFKKINDIPINSLRIYDNILVNEDNKILLFGSIFDNKDAQSLIKEILYCQSN